jgi:hypothetical protein
MAHDSLVDLFKNRPSLGAELLSEWSFAIVSLAPQAASSGR